MKPFITRFLKITGITLVSIVALLFLLPILFPGVVSTKIKDWTNSSIKGELNFSKARLSFFHHFPSLTLTLYDVSLKGAAPFQKDTLVAARAVSLGINLATVFSSTININKIYLDDANIHVQVNEKGEANYNVYVSSDTAAANAADSSGATLKMEHIAISHSNIIYDDKSLPMLIRAKGFSYTGSGDFEKAIFDLASHAEADLVDFYYDGQGYFISKQLKADLVTRINTNSLSLLFEKNDLKINSLPVRFKGRFNFLDQGYDMDFELETANTDLHDIFSALPAEYLGWLAKTEVKGFGDMNARLSGQYIAEQNRMPDLAFNMKIRDGFVANQKAPSPVKNLFLNMQARLPQCAPDSLYLNIDSIFFNIDNDYLSSVVRVQGIREPQIYAKMNAAIDLEKWDRAIGLEPFDFKGKCNFHLLAEGKYATSVVKKGLRGIPDTVISSIPHFNLQSSLKNGYFKYASLPQAVDQINFAITASCPDSNYKHTSVSVEDINAAMLGSYIKGFFKLYNLNDLNMESKLQSVLRLDDLAQVYPMDSLQLKGDLLINMDTKGKYIPAKRVFPVAKANLQLKNGFIHTKYYPDPIENIQVTADITNTAGNFRTLKVDLSPVSFRFAQQPFLLRADLANFDNLKYDIVSRGTLDLGKIYRVFAVTGYDLKGFIKANVSLHGSQADAAAGRFDRLTNKGSLLVKNIALQSEMFPQPFWVTNGLFRFDQDKMWFDKFQGKYGSAVINLNGHLSNVVAFATQKDAPLKGNFDLMSDYIKADELMVFADAPAQANNTPSSAGATGVILIPANLDLQLNANVKALKYQGLLISNAHGAVKVDSSRIALQKAGFELAGCKVNMDALYQSLTPWKASFNYHINAADFDVKRMYKEVELFRNMVTAAAKAEGVISLDYQLAGKLDANMNPVYPSLKGGGVLTVQKVKMHGFKLFNAMGSATGKDGVKDPDLSKIEIKSTIANNIITLERTKMKVAGFRPRFEGQVSFDGKMNLSGRLGLPPLGIIGIPFSVTGTQENPKIKLRRSRDSDKLEETSEEPD